MSGSEMKFDLGTLTRGKSDKPVFSVKAANRGVHPEIKKLETAREDAVKAVQNVLSENGASERFPIDLAHNAPSASRDALHQRLLANVPEEYRNFLEAEKNLDHAKSQLAIQEWKAVDDFNTKNRRKITDISETTAAHTAAEKSSANTTTLLERFPAAAAHAGAHTPAEPKIETEGAPEAAAAGEHSTAEGSATPPEAATPAADTAKTDAAAGAEKAAEKEGEGWLARNFKVAREESWGAAIKENFFSTKGWSEHGLSSAFKGGLVFVGLGAIYDALAHGKRKDADGNLVDRKGMTRTAEAVGGAALTISAALHGGGRSPS